MLAKWHITITDLEGNVIPNATVYVVSEASGGMPMLYADRAGTMPLGNPTSADSTGFCSFHVLGGAYAITARKGGFERTWRYVGIGTSQEYDVGALGSAAGWDSIVDTVVDLPSGPTVGERVLVLDADEGRAGVYEWSGTGWQGPIFITGAEGFPGPVNTLEIGTVEEGPEAEASITGQAPNQVLNLVLPLADLTPELQQLRDDAVQAAANAEDSEIAAGVSASQADAHRQAAQTAAANAAASATTATTQAGIATTQAGSAAGSASAAAGSASAAVGAAGTAQTSAGQAMAFRNAAEGFRNAAEGFATNAGNAADRSEAARDIAEGFASDIVSQGNVPLYATHNGFGSVTIPVGMQSTRLWGYSASGDGGAKSLRRVFTQPTHSGRVRSADRFQPDGSTNSFDGGWWEITDPVVTPRMFGAKGDGIADDTAALQAFFNMKTSAGEMEPDAKYRITNTVTMNVSRIRYLRGNNATILVDADVVGLDVVGTNAGSASPNEVLATVSANQMNPVIEGLRIASTKSNTDTDNFVGVGMQVTGTFALGLHRCNFYNLKTGLRFVGINRNAIIANNNIWNCLDYGVHIYKGDFHQVVFTGNHVSYATKLLYFEETQEITDWQIVGNDLELSSTPVGHLGHVIHFYHARGQGVTIVGNTIESHLYDGADLIRMEASATHTIVEMRIVGNKIARLNGATSAAIWFNRADQYVISDNTGRNLMGAFIKADLITLAHNVVVSGNSLSCFFGTQTPMRPRTGGGIFHCSLNGNTLQRVVITGNTAQVAHEAVIIQGNGGSGNTILSLNISNNVIDVINRSASTGDTPLDFDFAFDLTKDISTMRMLVLSGNIVAGNSIAGGFGVGPVLNSNALTECIISGNTSRQKRIENVFPAHSETFPNNRVRDNV